MRVGIIADDLAGANSAAAPFRQRKLTVNLLWNWFEREDIALSRADVLALDTETRHASLSEVAGRLQAAAILLNRTALEQGGAQVVFKYVDSLLRGQIGAELQALLAAYPGRLAVVAPSFPEYKHSVDMGQLLVNGYPLDETSLGLPDLPPGSKVAEIIGQGSNRRCAPVGLGLVRGGAAALEATFTDLRANGVEIAVCDALESGDLEAIAHVILQNPARYLAVGSAGMAGALVNHLPPHGDNSAPVLMVNGSLDPRVLLQSDYLAYHAPLRKVVLDLDWVLHGGDGARMSEIARCLQEVQQSLMANLDVMLITRPVVTQPGRTPPSSTQIAEIVGDTLGEVTAALLSVQISRNFPFAGLVIVGGNTAYRVCQKLEAQALSPHSEVMPGIAAARLQGGPYHNLPVVLHPANLGPDNALAESARYLKSGLE